MPFSGGAGRSGATSKAAGGAGINGTSTTLIGVAEGLPVLAQAVSAKAVNAAAASRGLVLFDGILNPFLVLRGLRTGAALRFRQRHAYPLRFFLLHLQQLLHLCQFGRIRLFRRQSSRLLLRLDLFNHCLLFAKPMTYTAERLWSATLPKPD